MSDHSQQPSDLSSTTSRGAVISTDLHLQEVVRYLRYIADMKPSVIVLVSILSHLSDLVDSMVEQLITTEALLLDVRSRLEEIRFPLLQCNLLYLKTFLPLIPNSKILKVSRW